MRILRGTGSRMLACGCLLGVYETYDGKTVVLVDAHNPTCQDARHGVDALIEPASQPSTVTARVVQGKANR